MAGGTREPETISIGAFARLTGLSVPRLRRYHDLGLLVADQVDPITGYRFYSPAQVGRAVAIARLRQADVSLEDMGQLLGGNDDAVAVLLRHRRRLEDRISSTQQMVDLVDQLIREERSNMPATIQLMEVILRVEDVEATVEFYRDVFGMDFQPDDHNGTLPRHYDACGGSWDPEGFFMFTIYPAQAQPTRTNLGFGAPDLDDLWARATKRGAVAISPPTDSGYMPRQAVFEDNAGNRVNVYQRAGDW